MTGPLLAVVGPTASGKTALALELAGRWGDVEIVSVDSRQLYRGLRIGTAAPTAEELARVPHHGIGIIDPSERYSAGRFGREARRWIEEVRSRGRRPLLVGGTGFFLEALTRPIFREPELDPVRREALRNHLSRMAPETLVQWVSHLDPERAEIAIAGGRQRILRTLELPLLTGRSLSWWHRHAPPEAEPLPVLHLHLDIEGEPLGARISARLETMWREGWVDEVEALLRAGTRPEDPGMTSTGYPEIVAYLRGEADRAETMARILSATRQYARRQRSWFRNRLPADTIRLDGLSDAASLADRAESAIQEERDRR